MLFRSDAKGKVYVQTNADAERTSLNRELLTFPDGVTNRTEAIQQRIDTLPIFAACLSGAVCGDHCSPISDTTIMASAGAHCSHVNHVSTQLPYAITAASCAAVCYMITGLAQAVLGSRASLFSSLVLLAVAIVVELVVLSIIRARTIKKAKA